ncbi:MAG TPA: HD-GYP domain-containing protein, partial [Synergistaceae bacterium]|nr:HD-GYP domain-containing protein [Synergistaceae bacterium]
VHLHLDILWIQGAFHFFLFALCGALLLAGFLFSLRGEKLTRSINEPIEDLLKRMEMLSENAASPALEKILLEAAPPSHLREIRQLSRGFEKMTLQIASAFQKQEKALQKEQEMAQRLNSILNTTVELTEAISSGSGDLFDTALKNAISLVPEAEHGAITAIEKNLCQFRAAHYAEKTPRLQSLLFPHSRENATSSEILRGKNYMETLSPSFNEVIREKLAKQMPASRDTLVKPLFFGTQCAGELILSIPEGSPHAAFSSESLRSAEAIGNGFAAFLGLEKFIKSQELFQKELFLAFAGILETHDSYTQGHSESVALLGAQTAKALGLQEKEVQKTYWAGLVHDIGKILIPREILNKPGALSSEEYELIKQHPALGHSVLTKTQRLEEVAPFVLHHHERWDGAGYPEGLRREGIPHIARILAVADAWDAMTSNRAYRQALSRETARQEILLGKETQFDPQVVDAFLPLIETPLL